MKELQMIDITRAERPEVITHQSEEDQNKEPKKRSVGRTLRKIRSFWCKWGISKDDLFGLLTAVGIMIQLPMIIWIFAATLP